MTMGDSSRVLGERTDGGLMLRVEGDGDAWMKTDDPATLSQYR